jgi:hypothetical protein
VAGVSTFVSGDAVNPSCGTGNGQRHREHRPDVDRRWLARCELVPGQSLTSGYDPTGGVAGVAFEDQAHFNLNAFSVRCRPTRLLDDREPRPRRQGQHRQRVLGAAA